MAKGRAPLISRATSALVASALVRSLERQGLSGNLQDIPSPRPGEVASETPASPARAGDGLELRGPVGGHFTWRVEDGGPLLLVAGGPAWSR